MPRIILNYWDHYSASISGSDRRWRIPLSSPATIESPANIQHVRPASETKKPSMQPADDRERASKLLPHNLAAEKSTRAGFMLGLHQFIVCV